MSIQTTSTTAKRCLILAATVGLGAATVHANLLVDDSMNRYSLFGKRGVHLDQYAKTARGGLLGSDIVVRVSGDDTMMAPVVVAGNLTMMNNVGNNWFRDLVRVGKDINGNTDWHDQTFDSAVYVAGNVGMLQHNNKFKSPLYMGGTLTKQSWGNTNQFNGVIFADNTNTTFNAPYPITGLNWGVAPQTVIPASMPWPDTTFAPRAGVSVRTGPASPLSGGVRRWTCGTNVGTDLVTLGVCNANDTILPPGNYDVLDIWFGSTIYLGEGTYSFSSVNLQNAMGNGVTTRLLAVQPHGLRTVILTRNGLTVNPSGSFNIIAPEKYQLGYGIDSAHFAGGTMMIYSESSLALNVSTEIWATVVVPKPGTMVELSDRVHLFGQILADSIHVKNYFKGTDGAFIPFYPNPPSVKVANFGWKGPEGSLGQTTAAGLNLQMDHVNGMAVKVWYHTLTPSRDTTIGGTSYKPAFAGDFDSSAGVVVIPATMTTGAIPVNIHGNNLHQPNRYFLVILDSIQNGSLDSTVLWNGKVAGGAYIVDDDPTPTFRVDSVWTTEGTGNGTKKFKFVLTMVDSATGVAVDPSRSGGASFTWSTIPGTADTTDFIPVHGQSITWPVGKMQDTLNVQVWQDSSYEATEAFLVRIDTFSNVQMVSPKAVRMALGKIINDDSVAKIFVGDTFAREGDTLSFRVWLSSVSALDACFNWQTSNGTAVAGKDYVASSGSGVCIHPGSNSMLLKVPTLADQVYEDTETVLLSLRPVSGITRSGSDTNAIGKILNTNPAPGISVNDTFVVRSTTTSKSLTFTVRLTDSSGQGMVSAAPSVFSYSLVPITATPGTDYVATSGQVTIPILTNSIAIPVTIPPDTRWYANPLQFKIVLTAVSGIDTTVKQSRTSGVGSIRTGVGKPVLHVYDSAVAEGNTGSHNALVFRVALLDSLGNATTSRDSIPFTWKTLAVGGTYSASAADFTAVGATSVAVVPGQSSLTVQVLLNGNNTYQDNRTLGIQLTGGCGCTNTNERLTAVGTIRDDDLPPKVAIDDQTAFRPKADSNWVFKVTLRDPAKASNTIASGKPVVVRIRTVDSSAKSALNDYAAIARLVVAFNPGEVTKTVSVMVHPDKRFSPTLAFKVVLDSLSGASFQDSLGVGTILNSNPRPIVRITGGRYEEGDTAIATIRLIDPRDSSYTSSRVPIPFTWTTRDSTAVKDTDFVWISRTPDTVKPFVQADSLLFKMVVHQMSLPQRDFRVILSPDTSTFQRNGSVLDAVVTVWNDYPPPKVWIRSERYPEPAAGDTAKFARLTVSLTAPSGYTNTVVVRTADSTAVAGLNYLPVLDTLVFPPKTTSLSFNVPLRNDGSWDTSKVFKALVVSRGPNLRDSVDGTVTVVNSDILKVGVTPSFQTVGKDTSETNYAVFHVTLSIPANQTVTVKYATRDSSVQASGLYQPISGAISFRPGQRDTMLRVTVPPSILKLTQANYFVLELDSAKVRLAPRDSAFGYSSRKAVVRIFDATNASRFSIDDVSTAKRDTVVWFRFHLNRPVASTQTIQFRTVAGTAQGGRDYRDTVGSYVIGATDTTGAIPVHILADSAYYATPRKFTLSVSYGDTFIVLRKPDGIGTITDLTTPPAVSISDAPAVRETQTAWFPIRTTKPNSDTMRVVWHTISLSAVAGKNFQSHLSDTLVVLPRQTSILLPVGTLDDGVYDTTLHFQVRIDTVLGGNGQVGSPRIGTGAIYDAGPLPAVKFATTDTSVREDISPDSLWLNVVLTRKMGYAVTVPVRPDTATGTARVPANFDLPVGSVTFPAGKDTVRLLVRIHHDSINTDNLKAVLKLRPDLRDSLTADADSTARVTIVNVDPPPFIAFRDSLVGIRASDTTVQVPLRLTRISGKTISGTLVASGGNARPGIDFDLPSGVFTLNPGTTSGTVALTIHDDHRYGPARDLWVHFTPMDTSKVLLDPLTSRSAGDARDTVFHLVISETTSRPVLSFSPTRDTAKDADRMADLGVVLSGLSDSVSKAGVAFLDSSKPELRKLHLTLVRDTATVDSAKLATTVRVVWTNDGKVYDTARTVHLVLRGSVGAGIGRDSIVVLVLLNTNKMPVVNLVTPADSSHTNKVSETARWTVDGVEQPTFNTSYTPGWNTVNACFTDSSGNHACDSARVWYDPYPPTVQVFKITGRNPLDASRDTTWWGDHARTRFGVDTVWYWVRDSIMNPDGKSWRVVVDTHMVVTDLHGDSLFAIPVSARDSAGNVGYDTGWISLKQSIPQVTIETPPNGAHVVVGELPVQYKVTDAGKTWTSVGSEIVNQPGPDPITRCYTDDVGNKGCDTHKVQVVPNEVMSSYYVDTDGDGKVDAVVVTMESRWTSSSIPSFTLGLNDSIRTNQKPDSVQPFYVGPPRGRPVVVKGDTIWVEAGSYLTDSLGHPLMGPDGKPLTSILGDTARAADGSVMRDSLGRVLYVMASKGKPDPTRFLVPIKPPFAFGQTGFAEAQPAVMTSTWTAQDSTGNAIKHTIVDSFKVADKVAPVILKAVIVRTESYKEDDTLRIVPSEPLNLAKGKDWLEVWRCPDGRTRCDSTSMVWVKVPADSVHKNADGSYWFLVPPGEAGSIRPNYKVRFLSDVSDTAGNGVSKTKTNWSTPVTGAPRPDIVQVTAPNRIPEIPTSEGDRKAPGTIIFKATRGSTVGGTGNMQWWEPGKGYGVDMSKVREICAQDNWCNGPILYINRPAKMIIYIYDLMGTYVTSKEATITQADIDAMQPDQLDRVSVELEWNHRTSQGALVASGVYLWRIISYVQLDNTPKPVMTNRLFKVGVKVY